MSMILCLNYAVIVLCVFMLGAVLCSAVNCLAYRRSCGESWVRGSSHCELCGHELDIVSLIPFFGCLIRRGKCHYCGEYFGYHHAMTEGITGVLFVFISAVAYCFDIPLLLASLAIPIAMDYFVAYSRVDP